MTANSKIEWTHHTFNPWWGCQRVSPGCEHCYAETFSKRVGLKLWGPESADTPRRFFGNKHWAEPIKWNASAAKRGVRERVFCASMADVFEDREDLDPHRTRLFQLITGTPHLDWLLLTKRPENIWGDGAALWQPGIFNQDGKPAHNVWLGCTAEDQQRADERIPTLLKCKPFVAKLFVSYEPALERVDFKLPKRAIVTMTSVSPEYSARTGIKVGDKVEHRTALDWIIVGGESGPGARPFDVAWARSAIEQCRAAGVSCFVKQLGAHVITRNDDNFTCDDDPGDPDFPSWPLHLVDEDRIGDSDRYQGAPVRVRLCDPKGGDPSEWRSDLRVREYPL